MVSACVLYLDDVELTEQKAFVPDSLSALFQESDRVRSEDADGEVVIQYRTARASMLRRLDLMGCTAALAEQAFDRWREGAIRRPRRVLGEISMTGTRRVAGGGAGAKLGRVAPSGAGGSPHDCTGIREGLRGRNGPSHAADRRVVVALVRWLGLFDFVARRAGRRGRVGKRLRAGRERACERRVD